MSKRLLSLLLALCLVISLGSIGAMAENESNSIYNSTTGTYYDSLPDALNAASSGATIYIESQEYTLSTSAIIPSGVTLVVPSNSTHNDTTSGNNASGSVTNPHINSKLIVSNGVTLTVNGTLLVAGNQQSSAPKTGCLTGGYGAIELYGNIIVYGKLYARGTIYGNGTVTAISGSEVYQLLQVYDFRGGNASRTAYNNGVFPFNRYEFKNITAKVVYAYGSSMYAQYYIYAAGSSSSGNIKVIGSSGIMALSSSGQSITTEYDNSTGRLTATIDGTVTTGNISLIIRIIIPYLIRSYGKVLPFGYNLDVIIPSDSTLNITNYIKLLPGCTFTNNGTLNVSSSGGLYVYGTGGYSTSYNYGGWTGMPSTATLTGTGAYSGAGTIASSDASLSNIPFSSYNTTISINEFVQNGNTGSTTSVTFYKVQ